MRRPAARLVRHRRAAAFAAGLLLVSVSPAFAAPDYIDLRRIEAVRGDAAAGRDKATTCIACHGDNGVSPSPMFPNLRGQTTEYLYWSLVDFKRGTRSPLMTPLVEPLSDQDMRDLAAFYAEAGKRPVSSPPAVPPADGDLQARGKELYLQGDAERAIPPCQGCHGADANGHPLVARAGSGSNAAYGTYPALRVQKGSYLVTRLQEYREGALSGSTNDFIMTGVARHLDDGSIDALAAWLSTLPMPAQ